MEKINKNWKIKIINNNQNNFLVINQIDLSLLMKNKKNFQQF